MPGKFYANPNDYRVICDRSGLSFWRSECVEEWTGLLVAKKFVDERHPQEDVRGVLDDQSVPDPRPRQPFTYLSANEVVASDI